MEKARQIGMSWAAAYNAVVRAAAPEERLDTWVASRDETQARLFLEDCRAFARVLDRASAARGQPLLNDTAGSSLTLRLANGRRLHCLSSNPDAQAGKRGTRILDEFALHPDPALLYRIAWPGVTWGGRLEIISTHRGKHNFFNHLVEEIRHHGNPKHISHHRVTIEDALAQGFLEKLQSKLPPDDPRRALNRDGYLNFVRERCPDEESWLQEYMCVPADDASAFLPYEALLDCESPDSALPPAPAADSRAPRFLYLGVDLGRVHDRTVFWLLERTGDLLVTRELHVLDDTPFSEQEDRLHRLLSDRQVRCVCIDQTGLGRQFAERATERYGAHRGEGLCLSAPVKEALAYPLRTLVEQRRLRLPADPLVRADLRSVRRETTMTGSVRFAAERNDAGHADRFWALALAIHAADGAAPSTPVHYESLSPSRARSL